MTPEFYWIAVAAVSITSAARLTRLATWDEFPPVAWLRNSFAEWTDKTDRRRGWQVLAFCGYCFSFWAMLAVVLAGHYSDWHEAWWIINSILGGSYLAAILMAHDGDDPEDSSADEDGDL